MLDDERFITPEQCGHSFPNQVVKLKYFDAFDGISARLDIDITATTPFATVTGDPSRKPVMRKDRKGQPIFRQRILRNYDYRCCISGDGLGEVLEAAHIQPAFMSAATIRKMVCAYVSTYIAYLTQDLSRLPTTLWCV